MSDSREFIIRTEDIRPEELLQLFVETERDSQLVKALKAPSPLIIEGSRGTGKSFLLRVCEQQQLETFDEIRVLPVYVSFAKSSLVHAGNPRKFQQWMLSRLCTRILRALYRGGLLSQPLPSATVLAGGPVQPAVEQTQLAAIAANFEESYRNPGVQIDDAAVPDVEDLKDAVQDICEAVNVRRINILFDEAAHIFRPEQQRQFFTMFRDLRSPYITCNAAVYPGVTAYGSTFESTHDARIESLNRDITDPKYRSHMRDILFRQADSQLQNDIEKNGESFDALAFAVSGNPRLLLKTVARVGRLQTAPVTAVIKEFFRTDIWAEHSGLTERYTGHLDLIDWGRNFVEESIIPDALRKNEVWQSEGKPERTCYFWMHRDSPEAVREALRLLAYTGIVTRLDSGIVATRRELGTRFAVNVGCLAAPSARPISFITDLRRGLSIKRFTEYGANDRRFTEIASAVGDRVETDLSTVIQDQLEKPIHVLDLSDHQRNALMSIGINTVGETLSSSEANFQRAHYIGPKRSRRIMNTATAAVLEYLSG